MPNKPKSKNMTPPNFEYIQSLIDNKVQESLTLDYKRELTNNREIAKDISSFANTSGGKIIYGIDETDGVPHSKNWIVRKDVKEKIESIILSSIQPEIKGYSIFDIVNPDDLSQAIFIVDIPESLNAPHMADHRYFIRRNFQSEPMEDFEVKNAIFKKGLRKALEFEVSQNLQSIDKIRTSLDKYKNARKRVPILLIPLQTEAWRAIVSSGILYVLEDIADTLVNAYNVIHEVNYLIDSLRFEKYGIELGTYTSVYESKPEYGTWIPVIIDEKISAIKVLLGHIEFG